MGDTAQRDRRPATPLIGPRIVVRPHTYADAAAMHDAIDESRDALHPWMPWSRGHQTEQESLEYIKQCELGYVLQTDYSMGIYRRSDGHFLGGTGLHPADMNVPSYEIGYWIRTAEQGKGYVSESVRLLATCAFDSLAAQRVAIHCDARNTRSRLVAERQSFLLEGRHRNVVRDVHDQLVDMLVYAMIPAEYVTARKLWP